MAWWEWAYFAKDSYKDTKGLIRLQYLFSFSLWNYTHFYGFTHTQSTYLCNMHIPIYYYGCRACLEIQDSMWLFDSGRATTHNKKKREVAWLMFWLFYFILLLTLDYDGGEWFQCYRPVFLSPFPAAVYGTYLLERVMEKRIHGVCDNIFYSIQQMWHICCFCKILLLLSLYSHFVFDMLFVLMYIL